MKQKGTSAPCGLKVLWDFKTKGGLRLTQTRNHKLVYIWLSIVFCMADTVLKPKPKNQVNNRQKNNNNPQIPTLTFLSWGCTFQFPTVIAITCALIPATIYIHISLSIYCENLWLEKSTFFIFLNEETGPRKVNLFAHGCSALVGIMFP